MKPPVSLEEVARINSTGETVRVLRRRSGLHDQQIMAALEAAGHFVIGTPQSFRYRRKGKRRFTRPEVGAVYLIDRDGKAGAVLPAAYFAQHYTIVKGDES